MISGSKLEEIPNKKTGEISSPSTPGKRPRDTSDNELDKSEGKKVCLDETVPLEGVLSDISDDDADEILNREDSVSRKYVQCFIYNLLKICKQEGKRATPTWLLSVVITRWLKASAIYPFSL